ncbi:MAG: phenylacetic acid degradation protein [Armatimonadetes bacterium CG_4_10_14_0_8_um_filter_66_14]|nr:MAG: phenylacetic acid degradation protein [Armatimonadetes bacterium CG_4_10_14_0_8_um_filter_66_14]
MRTATRLLSVGCALLFCLPTQADIFDYLAKPEPDFQWEKERQETVLAVKVTDLRFTSQVWQGIKWTHLLRVFEPPQMKADHALLVITGGDGGDTEKNLGVMACMMTSAPVVILYNIPNQPLFGNLREDALIAYTFKKFMETGDETWPLLFPMTKSAVKAMDVLTAYSKEAWPQPVDKFVVTGASKRGWTTWFCGAVDPRVKGIAPIVYDNLDLPAQMRHQLDTWGSYSLEIQDYTDLHLQQALQTDQGKRLGTMVDPFTYRDRITLPKLILNGTNDPYWTQDSLNLYWDQLVGPKHVLYIPNKGHDVSDIERLTGALTGFFRAVASGKSLPKMDWHHETVEGKCRLTVTADPAPQSGTLWVARSATKDFRPSTWEASPLTQIDGKWTGKVDPPQTGSLALFGELTFTHAGTYRLSTQLQLVSAEE